MLGLSFLQINDELLREESQVLNVAVDQEDEKPHEAKKAGQEKSPVFHG